MSQRDPNDLLKEDMEKYRRLERKDIDFTPPALVEIVLLGLAGLHVVAWLGAMFLVPDTITGQTWMALGALGVMCFGAPGVGIYWLRRGGAEKIGRMARQVMR
jgi:hypothetical protein